MNGREKLSKSIRHIVNINGAKKVTVELTDVDALLLAEDLEWCNKSRAPTVMKVKSVIGSNE